LFDGLYRVLNELIYLKYPKTGHRYPSESLIDSSNLDVPLTLTDVYTKKLLMLLEVDECQMNGYSLVVARSFADVTLLLGWSIEKKCIKSKYMCFKRCLRD